MNKAEKQAFVENFTKEISDAQAFALMSFSKLSVEMMTDFRMSLGRKNVRVKVLKNTLAKKILSGMPYKELESTLKGPTLVAYGKGDPVLTTKAIWDWFQGKEVEVKLKAGVALGEVMSEAQLKALSKLPGKNELFTAFLWALKSSPTKFLYALQDGPRRLGYALGALKAKKESEKPTQ